LAGTTQVRAGRRFRPFDGEFDRFGAGFRFSRGKWSSFLGCPAARNISFSAGKRRFLRFAANFSKGYHQSFSGFLGVSKNRESKLVRKRLVFPIEIASELFPGGWPFATQTTSCLPTLIPDL
jgi:hypothetical protein